MSDKSNKDLVYDFNIEQSINADESEKKVSESASSDVKSLDESRGSQVKSRISLKIILVGCVGIIAVGIMVGTYFFMQGSDPYITDIEPLDLPIMREESVGFTISQDSNALKINDVESQIAETLLDSRPTHNEVTEMISDRLDDLFDDPENLAKLREINRTDRQALQRDIGQVRESILSMNQTMMELKMAAQSLTNSQKLISERQTKLEKQFIAKPKPTAPKAKRVVLPPTIPWELVALGESVAIIKNVKTQDKIRVAVGHSVLGCGLIKSFDHAKRLILTSNGCNISRKEG